MVVLDANWFNCFRISLGDFDILCVFDRNLLLFPWDGFEKRVHID